MWCKKIELSLGKLTLLAQGAGADPKSAEERSKAAKHDAELSRVDNRLEVIRIQDRTYQLLAPSFQDALDDEAAVELAMQAFTPKVPKKYKVLYDDLQAAMKDLVAHKAMRAFPLINLLTLIRVADMGGSVTDLFCSAIRVADLGLGSVQKRQALRLIWRRCYLRDEWQKVNTTENMNDAAVSNILSQTQAYCTMVACMRYRMYLPPYIHSRASADPPTSCRSQLDRRWSQHRADLHPHAGRGARHLHKLPRRAVRIRGRRPDCA